MSVNQMIHAFIQGDHTCLGNIEACSKAGNDECTVCGARDCPHGEPLHYHHDSCPACFSEYQNNMTPDQKKFEIAFKALQFYAKERVYCYPEDWNCRKEGGLPKIEDYDECSYVAENAIAEILKIGGEQK